jgi:hypothetical protein
MSTSISQESFDSNFSSPQRTSQYNLLAILFFFMGAPHIYSFIKKRSKQRNSFNYQEKSTAQTANIFGLSLSRYLSILLLGGVVVAILKILMF